MFNISIITNWLYFLLFYEAHVAEYFCWEHLSHVFGGNKLAVNENHSGFDGHYLNSLQLKCVAAPSCIKHKNFVSIVGVADLLIIVANHGLKKCVNTSSSVCGYNTGPTKHAYQIVLHRENPFLFTKLRHT